MRRIIAVLFVLMCAAGRSQTFQHPGVLVSRAQLDFIKAQVQAHQEPFYSEYQKAVASEYGSLDYKVKGPPENGILDCGPNSKPDHGCHAQDKDASAAYLQAVLWWISGDHRYADNSIRIMNHYAQHLKGFTLKHAPLQAAWNGSMWPRAGEIIRYSNAGWKDEDIAAFSKMLTTTMLPLIRNGSGANGNFELSMIEAMMGIAVFTEDAPLMLHAASMWRERVPAYFYYSALDGKHPRPLPRQDGHAYWYGSKDLDKRSDGLTQETCRDMGHADYGISAAMAAAETAHIQGGHLFESEAPRLMAALELNSYLLLKNPVPKYICGGTINYSTGYTYVIGYNEFHNRLGHALPYTKEWIETNVEKADVPVDPHMTVFEPLTHAEDAGQASLPSTH